MEVQMYVFPTLNKNNIKDIELEFCNLLNKYREGVLQPEEKDWLDWANNVLQQATSSYI